VANRREKEKERVDSPSSLSAALERRKELKGLLGSPGEEKEKKEGGGKKKGDIPFIFVSFTIVEDADTGDQKKKKMHEKTEEAASPARGKEKDKKKRTRLVEHLLAYLRITKRERKGR